MKKTTLYLMMMVLSLSALPSRVLAAEKDPSAIASNPNEVPPEIKTMLARLDEINAMDKSTLNRSEKRALRKEVKAMKAAMQSSHHGIYLSLGAVIIIVLLLILIL